ncbi:hypothetical protein AA313_de0202373 [Arthrobotrys entomopaga]|nr:hypothetical protein AA313_de0202373 [Arthrobotrys entomopaga]
MIQFTTLLLLLAGMIMGVLADLKTNIDYTNGLSVPFDPQFMDLTSSPLESIDAWGDGWIPQGCKDRFLARGLSPKDAKVYNIKYTDCDRAWTFCRHKDAQLSIEQMADFFGRMPVHMRSLVRHPIALPQDGCAAQAFIDVGDIVMYGGCAALSVWVHETGHQLDTQLKPLKPLSGTKEWKQNLSYDSCVPDSYANMNVVEDFAQIVVVAQFNTLAGYKPQENYPGCMDHRHGYLEQRYRALFMEPGGTCGSRPADSKIVSMTATKRAMMKMMKRANETEAADPAVIGPCVFDI